MAGQFSLTRDQYADSIRRLSAAADQLAAQNTMHQLTWQPAAGERWNILECLDHVAVTTSDFLDSFQSVIRDAKPAAPSAPLKSGGVASTWFLHQLEPPPTKRVNAPSRFQPRPTLQPEAILPRYRATLDRVLSLLHSVESRDLNSVRFRHPAFPFLRFTVASGFLMIAAHTRRHLWQADQVTREPDFPR